VAATASKAAASPTAAPAATAAPEKVVAAEGITEYRLANGLRVLLFPDASKPTATVNITYLVGSRHEGYGESGMAHLLEHLAFKGTPRHRTSRKNSPRTAHDRTAPLGSIVRTISKPSPPPTRTCDGRSISKPIA
jgi:predicted Zn-dependent peptidase